MNPQELALLTMAINAANRKYDLQMRQFHQAIHGENRRAEWLLPKAKPVVDSRQIDPLKIRVVENAIA